MEPIIKNMINNLTLKLIKLRFIKITRKRKGNKDLIIRIGIYFKKLITKKEPQ